jgi:hypothetical protein
MWNATVEEGREKTLLQHPFTTGLAEIPDVPYSCSDDVCLAEAAVKVMCHDVLIDISLNFADRWSSGHLTRRMTLKSLPGSFMAWAMKLYPRQRGIFSIAVYYRKRFGILRNPNQEEC